MGQLGPACSSAAFHHHSIEHAFKTAGLSGIEITTQSRNGLGPAVSSVLRKKVFIPKRLSYPLLRHVFSNEAYLGKRLSEAGHGEAILAHSKIT